MLKTLDTTLIDLVTINIFKLTAIESRNTVTNRYKEIFQSFLKASKPLTDLISYNDATSTWTMKAMLWHMPSADNLKLVVNVRPDRSLYDALSALGGFVIPLSHMFNYALVVILGGVACFHGKYKIKGIAVGRRCRNENQHVPQTQVNCHTETVP